MEPYKLDASLDANKVFVVKRSELENRLDTEFYKNDYKELYIKLKSLNHYKLKDIAKFSSESWNQKDYFQNEFPYIEISEINLSDGSINNINLLPISEAPSRAKMIVKKNDIIISTTRPTRGAISFLNNINDIKIASTGFSVIREVSNDVSKEFLFLILRQDFILKQFGQRSSGGNYPAITQEELGKVIIPKIEKSTQQQIVDIFNNAYTQKQAKEAEAKALLASTDTYLLNELGITLPEKNNSLEARIFTTNFSEVVGGRFDPKLYDKTTTDLKKAIVKVDRTKFITKRLKDILVESVAGDWGIEDEEQEVLGYTKCLVIRATEFDNDYNLSLDNSRVKHRLIKDEKLAKLNIKEGDLLIEKSGGSPDQPVGRIALITKEELNNRLAYSNFIHKITVDNSIVNPSYLFAFLKTIHNIKLTEAMQSQTNGIRNLIMSTYLGQKIVLPINDNGEVDLEKQNEIANHIASIRDNAKALQQEAEQILRNAKQQVEQIILG